MTQTLTEFLLARIAEDEASADELHWDACEHNAAREIGGFPCDCWYPERVRARCQADRRIVELHSGEEDPKDCTPWGRSPSGLEPCDTLSALARVYADHPEFREEWRA